MKKLMLLTAVLLGIGTTASADDDAPTITVKHLRMSTAITIAQEAVAECDKRGIQVGVTVVDRSGHTQVMMRNTIAAPLTEPISKGKAYAAVMFNVPTADLGDRANSPISRIPGLVMATGGLPIHAGGSLLGGVGVSGAPSGITDEECAQAGINAVLDDLELAF